MADLNEQIKRFEYEKREGVVGSVKTWTDGWVWKEVWGIFNALANSGPEHLELLQLQAYAKATVGFLRSVETEETTVKMAIEGIKKAADRKARI